MNVEQLNRLRLQIESSLSELRSTTPDIREHLLQSAQAQSTLAQDSLDHAKEDVDLKTQLTLHKRNRNLEIQLQAALGRMRNGTFGFCMSCEEEINPRRLEAYPIARQCLKCQAKHEKSESVQACPSWSALSDEFARAISFQNLNLENL